MDAAPRRRADDPGLAGQADRHGQGVVGSSAQEVKRHVERVLRDAEAREAFNQLVRYGIIGALITLGGQAIYYGLAESRLTSPLMAIAIAFVIGLIVGYFAHGWVSFRGHGERDDHARIGVRFVAVNVFAY